MKAAKNTNVGTVVYSNIKGFILGLSLVTGALVVCEITFEVGKLSCPFSIIPDRKIYV